MSTAIKIGPDEHGRRMTLGEFRQAEVHEGYLYELGRGVLVVSDVPKKRHLAQVKTLRRILGAYDLSNPGKIDTIAFSGECKILLPDLESERHPDVAVYLTAATDDGDELWSTWIPDIVIEVVSVGSEYRDYFEKREEYLAFGVREYWIVDYEKQEMLVLRRSGGRWAERIVRPAETYQTRLLPGFILQPAQVFAAAE